MCKIEQLDQEAQRSSSPRQSQQVVQQCPGWTVRVVVRSTVDSWPNEQVRVWLQVRRGTFQPGDKFTRMEATTSAAVEFTGRGEQQYMARASTGNYAWKFVEKEVSVNGSQQVDVELRLEPTHYVAFKLVNDATGDAVTGPTFKLTLPGNVQNNLKITNVDTGEHALDISREETTAVKGLDVPDDEIWEVVSLG